MVCRFGFKLVMAAVCLFGVGIPGAAQDVPSIRLLPTDREAARVRVLEDALDKHLTDDVRASYILNSFHTNNLQALSALATQHRASRFLLTEDAGCG